jgi:transposase
LVECAWAATHCKQEGQDFLRNKYYSLAARLGAKKALIAIGHKILCAAWHMLKNKEPFIPPDLVALQQKIKTKQLNRYLQKIKQLGYQIAIEP